jgi:hypothetical protein
LENLLVSWDSISKKTGEPPVIIDSTKTKKSILRLNYYYFNNGFNVDAAKWIPASPKEQNMKSTGKPYFLDVQTTIATRVRFLV